MKIFLAFIMQDTTTVRAVTLFISVTDPFTERDTSPVVKGTEKEIPTYQGTEREP